MKYIFPIFPLLLSPALPSEAWGQGSCPSGGTCVPRNDIATFVKLLKEKRCLQELTPTFDLDPITIVTDKDGRVYYSGSDPKPYTLKMSWCSYEVIGKGSLKLVVAQDQPPTWGFRFRPKFMGSFLFTDGLLKYENKYDPSKGVDISILWDFAYWRALNLNVATGIRSVGAGIGFDLTKNFGTYFGYAFSFWTLKHNLQVGLYFGFW